jgi:phosphoglycolate phosphatase
MGLEPPGYERLRQIVGLNLHDGLALLAPDMTSDQVVILCDNYRKFFSEMRKQPGFVEPLYAGAADLLARLKARGWKLALATGKSRRGVDIIVQMHDWGELFGTTHCGDEHPGKPHPAMLIEAMRVLGAAREDTLMVGDTSHDMKMAQAAGVRAVAVTWGFHTRAELEACGPDLICDTFEALEAELERFGAA